MNDYIDIIDDWQNEVKEISIARVIKTWGSSPRPTGSLMMVNSDGKMAGSVSGGCVEGAVVKAITKNNGSEKLDYGVRDDDAWSVGLSCGGRIQVFIQPVDFTNNLVWKTLLANQRDNKASILISSLENGQNRNSLITEAGEVLGDELSDEIIADANASYNKRIHSVIEKNGVEYFIQVFPRKSQLFIIGAAHITVDLVSLANQFGFETIVIDPRGYFAENTTFSNSPSQLIKKYPSEVLNNYPLDAYTYCAILSHDPKIDDDALQILLKKEVAYIGALGSRKTHAKRTARLQEHGFDQAAIDKISAPIGMNINAKTAKEIALAVMGQIIEAQNRYL